LWIRKIFPKARLKMFIEKKAFPSLKLENVTIKIFEFLLVNDYKKNVSQ